jgi:hypothetical protein
MDPMDPSDLIPTRSPPRSVGLAVYMPAKLDQTVVATNINEQEELMEGSGLTDGS